MLLNVSIISSTTGGSPGDVDAYDRETTIHRIQQTIEALVSEHVSRGQRSTFKLRVRKPGGVLRRIRGALTTVIEFRIAAGTAFDMDRSRLIRSCQEAVPDSVTANIPEDHLCSLVVALKI